MDDNIEEIIRKALQDIEKVIPNAAEDKKELVRKFMLDARPSSLEDLALFEAEDFKDLLPTIPTRKLLALWKRKGKYIYTCVHNYLLFS